MANSRIKENVIHGLFFLNGLSVVLVLVGIFVLLVTMALPAFKEIRLGEFLFSASWNPTATFVTPSYGILSMFVSTLMVSIGALLIAIPIGIGAAAYLSDVRSEERRVGKEC